jgi:hypothetical protein
MLKEIKNQSILKDSKIYIVEIDINDINEKNIVKESAKLCDLVMQHDKLVKIISNTFSLLGLIKNEDVKRKLNDDNKKIKEWAKIHQKLHTYFPSQEYADMENMSLKDFYKLFLKASSLDWEEMFKINEELVKLFKKYDYVKII